MKRLFKKVFAAAAMVTLPYFAQAQEYTIQQCVEFALKNNIALKINALTVEGNQATLIQSKMARLPNLNGFANQGFNIGRNIDPFTNSFTTDPVRSNTFNLSTNVVLFNGLRQVNTIKQNQITLEASQFDLERAKNDLTLDIINAYVTIMFNRELLGVSKLQLSNTEEQLDRTMKLIQAGSLPEANKYNLISQKALDEQGVTSSENNVMLANLRLKQLLQIPDTQPFEVVIPQVGEPASNFLTMAAVDVYKIAEGSQPQIKSADKNIEGANLGIEIAKGNAYPTLTLNGSISAIYSSQNVNRVLNPDQTQWRTQPIGFVGNDPTQIVNTISPTFNIERRAFASQLDQSRNQNFSLALNVPIFNRYQIKTAVANAKIQQERATLTAMNVRNQLRQLIEQAYADARAANKTYDANKVRVEASEQALKVAEQRLNFGSGNATDYSVAKNNLNIAQSELIRAKYNYILRIKVLDFYAGKPLEF